MNIWWALLIITSILGGNWNPDPEPARDAKSVKARAEIKTWEINLIRYRTRHGQAPMQAQGLKAMVVKPVNAPILNDRWTQLAKPETLLDPWGRPYQYRIPGKHNPGSYDVYSLGPDGIEGTADDIGNW
jgi:general secretion pathway protein G